jgi:hypothetical protein
MAKLVKEDKLSKKSGLVAISRIPFLDDEIKKLTTKLKKIRPYV